MYLNNTVCQVLGGGGPPRLPAPFLTNHTYCHLHFHQDFDEDDTVMQHQIELLPDFARRSR